MPWNSPIILGARSFAPALAAGCSVVVKMPGQVAQTAAVLAEILSEVKDLPNGVMNIFAESGSEGAALLVESADVPTISFTGSSCYQTNILSGLAMLTIDLEMIVSYNSAMNQKTEAPVGPGRPREFDTNAALNNAITRFSEYGYHGTSISDLNACLGLTSGSIYKAWGDKRGLFLAALDRYMTLRNEAIAACLANELSGKDKIEVVLNQYAQLSSEKAGRTGCLVIESAVELSLADSEISGLIAVQQSMREKQLLHLIEEGQMDGSVRREINAPSMAKLLLALQQGMRILGKTGSDTNTMVGMVAELTRLL